MPSANCAAPSLEFLRHGLPLGAAVLASALIAACADAPKPAGTPPAPISQISTEHGPVRVRTLTTGLEFPWGLAFLPDGRMLITERPGRLRIVSALGALDPLPVRGTPQVDTDEQGGLLDVAVHPQFAHNGWIYIAYVARTGTARGTEVLRARLVDNNVEQSQVVFRLEPKSAHPTHYGARLAFGGDGSLLITLGDRSEANRAQRLDDHAGKVVRLLEDGRVPHDNPFASASGARPQIYTLGHRNVQGVARHPWTGRIWITEHGQDANDRFVLLEAGADYGWPHEAAQGRRFAGPQHAWTPTIAPSGLAFYAGDRFPQWRNSAFVGSLKDRMLVRLELDGDRVVGEERLLKGVLGRIRDVRIGPDGLVYLLVDDRKGRLVRLEPAG